MRRGLWLPLLAILSMLLHGVAVARHHAIMLGSGSGHAQLLADLGVICSPGLASKSATDGQPASLPDGLPGGPSSTNCPVCLGQVGAVTIVPIASSGIVAPDRSIRSHDWHERQRVTLAFEADWPPGTGPPAIS